MSVIILRGEAQREFALSTIRQLNIGKLWQVEIKPYVKKRSNPQLALYWSWMNIISKDTGSHQNELHETFKEMFLAPEVVVVLNKERLRYTTGKLTAKEMSEYMERILAFVTSELGIFLPLPEDQLQRA